MSSNFSNPTLNVIAFFKKVRYRCHKIQCRIGFFLTRDIADNFFSKVATLEQLIEK